MLLLGEVNAFADGTHDLFNLEIKEKKACVTLLIKLQEKVKAAQDFTSHVTAEEMQERMLRYL